MDGEHPGLGEGLAEAPARRLPVDIVDAAPHAEPLVELKALARRRVVALLALGLAPGVQYGDGVRELGLAEGLLLVAVGVHEGVHEGCASCGRPCPRARRGRSCRRGSRSCPVLVHLVAPLLELDAVEVGLGLREVLEVVVLRHELVEVLLVREGAGHVEEGLALLRSLDHEGLAGDPGDLVAVGVAEEVEVREAELGDAVRKHVERGIELVTHLEGNRGELGVGRYWHGSMIRNAGPPRQAPTEGEERECQDRSGRERY